MEEEKKKKKQKKKKNKSGKTNANVPPSVGEQPSQSNNCVNVITQNPQNLNSETADVQNKGSQESAVDSDKQSINGTEISNSVDADKFNWLDREAVLVRKIRELQEKLAVYIQKEADQETNVSQSQSERISWHQKEAELQSRISHLQTEKDSWLLKEASYEKKISQLVDETSTLRSMEVSLKEKVTQMEEEKVTLAQRENLAAETIAYLNKDNARLRAQVIELEASRNDTSHQNQQLKEYASDLQSKIAKLENSVVTHSSSERTMHVTENEEMKSQLEAAQALVEKLLSENEMLVMKANNLNAALDQKRTTESSMPVKSDGGTVRSSKAADVAESSAPGSYTITSAAAVSHVGSSSSGSRDGILSGKVMDSLNNELARLKSKGMNSEGSDLNQIPRASVESAEIVQIPLTESEVSIPESTNSTTVPEKEAVPLTDAPLVGAPFRLISFVARYVSGADLVNKNQESS